MSENDQNVDILQQLIINKIMFMEYYLILDNDKSREM